MKDKVKFISLVVIFIALLVIVSVFIKYRGNINEDISKTGNREIAIEVDNSNFESEVINSDKKVLIDFYATWCGPCKTLSPILEEVAKENDDIKLVKIDVDENSELVYKYGITAMPTLVVIENGEEINRSVGAISREKVLSLLGIK